MKAMQRQYPKATIRGVQRALKTLPKYLLRQAEGLAVFGSLARGYDWHEYSDIDIVVVIKDCADWDQTWRKWNDRIRKVLHHYGREVTVLLYTVEMVKEIPQWETLRMCTDAKVVIDNDDVRGLFRKVVKAAENAGLKQKWLKDHWVWYKPDWKWGENIEFRVEE